MSGQTEKADVRGSGDPAKARRFVSFEEYVRARFDASVPPPSVVSPSQRDDFHRTRDAFQAQEGRVIEGYWSVRRPAGVALARRRNAFRPTTRTRVFRWTDWLTHDQPKVAAALYEGDNLAHRCEEVLRGSTQRIALNRVFGAMSSLLSAVEANASAPDSSPYEDDAEVRREAISDAIALYQCDIASATDYYRQSAARSALIFYFWGMVIGVCVIAVLTTAIVVLVNALLDRYGVGVATDPYVRVIGTVSAGALGAIVSVMWRMSSGAFRGDFEAGSGHLRMLGAFRPFIGGVFGLALYFALEAGFLQPLRAGESFYFFAFMAFIGGFSERFAPDVFGRAAGAVQPAAAIQPPGTASL